MLGQRLLPARARQRQAGDKLRKLLRLLDAGDIEDVYDILVAQWDRPSAALPGATVPVSWARREAAGLLLPSVAERMIFQDLIGYLHDDILVKVDRASMAASLEARAPLLDHRLVEFMWRLPLSFRIRDGRGKWLLRRIVYWHVPRALVERPKTGFGLPIGAWLRGPLREWAEPRSRGCPRRRRLRCPRRRRRVAAASRRRGRGAAPVAGPDVPGLASAVGLRDLR